MSASTIAKCRSILLAVTIFAILGGLTTMALGRPPLFGLVNAILIGISVGVFEEFYVQSRRGRWLRRTHAVRSLLLYVCVVVIVSFVSLTCSHIVFGSVRDLPAIYQRLPIIIPVFIAFSVVGILVMRAVHFIGGDTLLHLMLGTYHRPVLESKMLMFVDMDGSTAIGEKLGAFQTRSLVTKFIFDVSKPIGDSGGSIYLYKGDGLIAAWDWAVAIRRGAILEAVDAMFSAVAREGRSYQRNFGLVPTFRIGIHGGDVVVSELGDTKRAIGIYGNAINIAARMEEAAKVHHVSCVLSGDVSAALGTNARFRLIGTEAVRGISAPLSLFEYQRDVLTP